jgi:ornithine carbamoyltransferase
MMNIDVTSASEMIAQDKLGLRGKSLLSIGDLTPIQLAGLLELTGAMYEAHHSKKQVVRYDYPKTLAMIFEKPSLRTRVTFETGIQQLGGLAVILGPNDIGLGKRESIPDVARCMARWCDAIMARVFDHQTLVELDRWANIPVINALSDVEHPCQTLADLYTIIQKKGKLKGVKLAWVGDGNNVLHSLMLAGAMSEMHVTAACPKGYLPNPAIVSEAKARLQGSDSSIEIVSDPRDAVRDADVIYTDTWISMGDEAEADTRRNAFADYQVNLTLMKQAKPDAIFLHCLPAHRGEEVTDEVMDGDQSAVFDEAENRLHAQKAIMACLM